jgi:hypothetical protein
MLVKFKLNFGVEKYVGIKLTPTFKEQRFRQYSFAKKYKHKLHK